MARITINGIAIDYDLIGPRGAPAIALTPGGRFARDSAGLPELADALAADGRRVLLWDRPNCGASDISFAGDSESELHAHTLTELIRALELGPTALAAGSAGSRTSLIAASRDPEVVSHLILWWISGGPIGLLSLAYYYCCESAIAASIGGMAAVAELPAWAEQIERNPANRDILLAHDPQQFIGIMERWAMVYIPSPDSPVPGMSAEHFRALTMPTLIYRSGESDLSHTRQTSEWVHQLIPHAILREPPWPDEEWNNRLMQSMKQSGDLFSGWPALADDILNFTRREHE